MIYIKAFLAFLSAPFLIYPFLWVFCSVFISFVGWSFEVMPYIGEWGPDKRFGFLAASFFVGLFLYVLVIGSRGEVSK